MPYRNASYDKSYVGSSSAELKSGNVRKPPTGTALAVPATVSEATAVLAAALRLAGFSARSAAIMAAAERDRWRAKLSARARGAA
jgi:hypothetical protein